MNRLQHDQPKIFDRTGKSHLLLGKDYADRYDDFDLVQLAHVIEVCRVSDSAADAARKLYAVSFKTKTSSNSTDRLSKYLARFGLKFREIVRSMTH